MKVTFVPAQEPAKKEKPFPKCMIGQYGLIVYFHERGEGIVVDAGNDTFHKNGYYVTDMNMPAFSDMPEGSKLVIEF